MAPQPLRSLNKDYLDEETMHRLTLDTLEELDWCLDQLEAIQAHRSVGDLATSGFAPVVNAGYNTAATPATVMPFPTVFGYDERRVSLSNASSGFDRGFVSPAALTDALEARSEEMQVKHGHCALMRESVSLAAARRSST